MDVKMYLGFIFFITRFKDIEDFSFILSLSNSKDFEFKGEVGLLNICNAINY